MLSAEQIKNQLSVDDIIKIMTHLQQDDTVLYDSQGHPIFSTSVCHKGDSFKLYYYNETKLFHCYTCGKTSDIFELVQKTKEFTDFMDAYNFVVKFFNIKNDGFHEQQNELTSDWDIFHDMEDFNKISATDNSIMPIQENLLEYFYPLAAPVEWLKEGISADVMRYYGIRVDTALHKIIIPHRDMNGKLIGIRGRSYNPIEIQDGKKYMPVFIEGDIYAHPLGKNLFGLYENKDTIKKVKKVLIVEAEKSVMMAASFYGVDNCFCLATCGSSLTQAQIDLIMSLGVTEVILGYDKEYTGRRGEPQTEEYEKKLLKTIQPLSQYFNTYIIMDYEGLLDYKDSPTDKGKEVLEKLLKQKIYIPPITNKAIKRRR